MWLFLFFFGGVFGSVVYICVFVVVFFFLGGVVMVCVYFCSFDVVFLFFFLFF